MATTVRPVDRVPTTQRRETEEIAGTRELVKFAVPAAAVAMFADAAIGHALLWENDPFWTYWVTDSFLIATIFAIGTALVGVGIAKGAAIAAVQAIVLTVYYWSLSPIGLPSQAEWLDLEHTWVTGVPVHFGVYYLGYLVSLWLWRRRQAAGAATAGRGRSDVSTAVIVAAGVVAVAGVGQWVLLGDAPGVQWFLARTIIAFVFTLVWRSVAGRDRAAAVGGALALAFVLLTYAHFLGPVGLPDMDLRVLDADSPPASAHWLTYVEEWLVAFPLTLAAALGAFLLAHVRDEGRWSPLREPPRRAAAAGLGVLAVVAAGVVNASAGGPDDHSVDVTAEGRAALGAADATDGDLEGAEGVLSLRVRDRNPRVSSLPPHDQVDLSATFTAGDGRRFDVEASDPIVADPVGRFTTWGGVGFDKWHHGRSGIGTTPLPPIRSEVAAFALADVRVDGRIVATGVPVQAATLPDAGVHLVVGDPRSPIPGVAEGAVRVVWPDRVGASPEQHQRAHNVLGSAVLLGLIALVITAIRTDRDPSRASG